MDAIRTKTTAEIASVSMVNRYGNGFLFDVDEEVMGVCVWMWRDEEWEWFRK